MLSVLLLGSANDRTQSALLPKPPLIDGLHRWFVIDLGIQDELCANAAPTRGQVGEMLLAMMGWGLMPLRNTSSAHPPQDGTAAVPAPHGAPQSWELWLRAPTGRLFNFPNVFRLKKNKIKRKYMKPRLVQ